MALRHAITWGAVLPLCAAAVAQPCLVTYTFTAAPPPAGGIYQAGQTVTFCLTITNWNTTNANWLHGVVPLLGAGWDAASLTPGTPPATMGPSTGTWGWWPVCTGTAPTAIGPVGPGFFFDLDNDGNPGNNFGDYVNGASNWQFCWDVTVPVGAACVDGADLSMTAAVYGDSETGAWGSSGCTGDPNPIAAATAQCCQADAGSPATIDLCTNGAPVDLFLQLGGTPDPGGTWTGPGGAAFTNPFDPSTDPSGAYTYTVPDVLPCLPVQATVTVNIATAMDAGIDAPAPLCADAPPLNMFGALGGTPDPGGNWLTPGGAPFGGTFNAATDPPGVYAYVTPAVAPCVNDTALLTISVDPLPDAGGDGAIELCADEPNEVLFNLLGGSPDAGGTWIDPNNAIHSGTLDPSTELSGDYLYVVQGTGQCASLSDTAIVSATLNHMPEVAFAADPLAGCEPLVVTFENNTPTAQIGTLDWSFGDGQNGSTTGSFDHTYSDAGVYDVSLTVTSPEGCVATVAVADLITVSAAPTAAFDVSPNPATTANSTVLFTAMDPVAVQWDWTIADLGTSDENQFQFEFPDVVGGEYEICLTTTDTYGCTATQCETLVVKAPLFVYVPNAFTPNGDGTNDQFHATIFGSDPLAYHLYIYDRWGGKVFESTDMLNVWTGAYMNNGGEPLPEGVYAWRLLTQPEEGGGKKEFMGHVSLLK